MLFKVDIKYLNSFPEMKWKRLALYSLVKTKRDWNVFVVG